MAANLAVRSSVPLQVLLYLNQWYYIFWLIVEALSFVFKGQTLPFASGVLAAEIILFIVLFIVDMFRNFFATKANLTERILGLVISLIITIPCIGGRYKFFLHKKFYYRNLKELNFKGTLYFILWQQYVLRVELIINSIQLAFLGLESILELISIIIFARSRI